MVVKTTLLIHCDKYLTDELRLELNNSQVTDSHGIVKRICEYESKIQETLQARAARTTTETTPCRTVDDIGIIINPKIWLFKA